MKKTMTVRAYTKAVDEEKREVEQIVSVFENVDLGKDRVKTGAFAGSLERWSGSGDPIPVIWSHAWDDPFAHIGFVLEAKELAAGDPLLPDEIADLGGLYTRYKVDEKPFADQVFDLLKTRRVREASFAYDVIREKRNGDGTTDLLELDVIEVGPTLKGMNPMTQLLAAKAYRAELVSELVKAGAGSAEQVEAAVDAAGGKAYPAHTFLPKDDEPDRCSVCDLTRNTLAHLNLLAGEADGTKAVVTLAGSLEETLDSFYRVAVDHALAENLGNGGFYALHPEGTYPDERRAVYTVEGWDDPWGEGAFLEFRFAQDADGVLSVESVVEVVIEATTRPKARGKAADRLKAKGAVSIVVNVGAQDDDEVDDETDPSPAAESDDSSSLSPASVLVDAVELELAGD